MRDKNELQKIKKQLEKIDVLLSPQEQEFLYATSREIKVPGVIVEIGSRTGGSTILLGSGSKENENKIVYAIDPHYGTYMHKGFSEQGQDLDTFEEFTKNINEAGFSDIVIPIKKTSRDAAESWSEKIAILWIDGDHRYEGVKKDYELYAPFVSEGGIIAFHDANCEDVLKYMKEMLPRADASNVGLLDSIVWIKKAKGRKNFIKSRLVLLAISAQDLLRNIPLPKIFRSPIKLFGKTAIQLFFRRTR